MILHYDFTEKIYWRFNTDLTLSVDLVSLLTYPIVFLNSKKLIYSILVENAWYLCFVVFTKLVLKNKHFFEIY